MRPCEFCSAPVDETHNTCTSCGATQSTWPTPQVGPQPKVGALWLGWVFTPWLSGIGLIWIGTQANKKAWIAEGVFYMLPLVVFMWSPEMEPSDAQTGWAIIFWIAAIVRAFKLKNEYNALMRAQRR